MKTKLLILAALLPFMSYAQGSKDSVNYAKRDMLMADIEFGIPSAYGTAGQLSLSLKLKSTYYKLKISSAFTDDNEFAKEVNCQECHFKNSGITEFSGIIGKSLALSKHFQFQLGGGAGVVVKTFKDNAYNATRPVYLPERYKEKYTAGISSEIKTRYIFIKGFSANFTVQNNINPIKSYAMVTVGGGFVLF